MIPVLFNILLFLIPLVFYKNTSELFELNKIIILYSFTALITSAWVIKMISHKTLIFRRTILDIPLILYLFALLLSTLFSIDPRTSLFGYYSTFNGGLLAQVSYTILYWAFVSNMTTKNAKQSLVVSLWSLLIVSILAIAEKFGIFATCGLMGFDYYESCWTQDIQNRVFSTLGQPNWLAALLVALLPIIWSRTILQSKILNLKSILWLLVSIIFFVALLFTKSRSGFLGIGIGFVIFWSFIFWKEGFKFIKEFIFIFLSFSFLAFIFVFQPISQLTNNQASVPTGPALETGGTESGTIRKYVWLGAIEVFKNYPIIGSGTDTFAYTFPKFKPAEHNLTSEWNFIYNRAHNEYLNILANNGIVGFATYVALIIFSIKLILNNSSNLKLKDKTGDFDFWNFGIFSGYVSILITNFFGFSVVPISLLFFLFPAIGSVQSTEYRVLSKKTKLNGNQVVGITLVLCTMSYVLFCVAKYWQADIYYSNAKKNNRDGKSELAMTNINRALEVNKNEPLYLAELSLATENFEESARALDASPYNQNIRNILISNLNKAADQNSNTLLLAEEIAKTGTIITPKNPRIFYQLGILNIKNNKLVDGLLNLEKSVELKPNYKEARFALGLTQMDIGNFDKAIENFTYILDFIDPEDELTKKYLEQAISGSK